MAQNRREWMLRSVSQTAAVGAGALLGSTAQAAPATTLEAPAPAAPPDGKSWRIGVISARINGKPQRINGHTWHFAQYLHPAIDLKTAQKNLDPGNQQYFEQIVRNPACNFGILPFSDTRITHYYEADPEIARLFADSFPGVQVATSLEEMAEEVDAVWLGDASGTGDDHFDLLAPALTKGLPTFCDKPIGETVAGTRKILNFAHQHKAPLMSGSIFSYEWGVEEVRRLLAKGELGEIQYVIASMQGGYSPEMLNMARTFRDMVRTRVEPVPHQQILEVTAMLHAGAKSLQEKSRLVPLAEVLN